MATIGPSAILTANSSSSLRPSHFFVRFFLEEPDDGRFSPPKPNHSRPSAVPAAMTPVDDIAVDMMNGGDSAIPPVTVKGAGTPG
jgi:hypothetical protein